MKGRARTYTWVKMPTNWIRYERGLDRFTVGELGVSVSALKIYIALAAAQHVQPASESYASTVRMSYTEIAEATGVARAMIGPSLSMLAGLIQITRGEGRQTNEYVLNGFEGRGGWAKLPAEYIGARNTLPDFSSRLKSDLGALKLYLLLLSFRTNTTGLARLSYDKATDYLRISRSDVSAGKSRLIDSGLIRAII